MRAGSARLGRRGAEVSVGLDPQAGAWSALRLRGWEPSRLWDLPKRLAESSVPSRSDCRGEQRLDGDVHLKGRPRRPLLRNVRVSYSNNRRYRLVAAFTRRDANAKRLS